MQSGVLDGFLTSTESMFTNRFYEVGKFATLGGKYNFATSMQPLMMSRKHWDALTEGAEKGVRRGRARDREALCRTPEEGYR